MQRGPGERPRPSLCAVGRRRVAGRRRCGEDGLVCWVAGRFTWNEGAQRGVPGGDLASSRPGDRSRPGAWRMGPRARGCSRGHPAMWMPSESGRCLLEAQAGCPTRGARPPESAGCPRRRGLRATARTVMGRPRSACWVACEASRSRVTSDCCADAEGRGCQLADDAAGTGATPGTPGLGAQSPSTLTPGANGALASRRSWDESAHAGTRRMLGVAISGAESQALRGPRLGPFHVKQG